MGGREDSGFTLFGRKVVVNPELDTPELKLRSWGDCWAELHPFPESVVETPPQPDAIPVWAYVLTVAGTWRTLVWVTPNLMRDHGEKACLDLCAELAKDHAYRELRGRLADG